MLSGGGDGNVKVWDMREMWCVNTLKAHTGAITCLDFDRHYLVTGGYDQLLRGIALTNPFPLFCLLNSHIHSSVGLFGSFIQEASSISRVQLYYAMNTCSVNI